MNKKLFIVVFAAFFSIGGASLYAQRTFYSVVVNYAQEGFKFPLLGIVNIGIEDHAIFEIGAFNINTGRFNGLQAGAVNWTGGGAGLALGAVNINTTDFYGVQFGAVNLSLDSVAGLQIGLINIAADGGSVLPLGLLPIILHGGYYALEAGITDLSPLSVSFKMGVEKLYTSVSCYYSFDMDKWGAGAGLGSLINLTKSFFFNLEINTFQVLDDSSFILAGIECLAGYNIIPHLSVVAGPTYRWAWESSDGDIEPFFKVAGFKSDGKSSFLGAKLAVRFRF